MALMSEEARRTRIAAAIEALAEGEHERITLPWRDGSEVFAVVKIELDASVLNPRSHRIRAQLESDSSAAVIEAEPFGEEAQDAIARILRETTENFDALKTNIKEEGQQQPGVITRSGMLVNANTRAVALRDLGKTYIRAAVLPDDATPQEIDELELKLQMQKEFRQEYTFTNELLFVNELIQEHNRSEEEVAKALRWAPSSAAKDVKLGKERVQRAVRMLAMVREIQQISGNTIPLPDFDAQSVALEELDKEYQDLNTKDPDAAQQLKTNRILGMLTGLGYRELRDVGPGFVEEHLLEVMEDDDLLGDHVDVLTGTAGAAPAAVGDRQAELEGLDVLEGDQEAPAEGGSGAGPRTVTPLVEIIAQSRDKEELTIPTADGGKAIPRPQAIDAVRDVMKIAASEAKSRSKEGDRLHAPISRLADAENKLKRALEAYEEVSDEAGFDADKFKDVLARCRRRLDALDEAAGVDPAPEQAAG